METEKKLQELREKAAEYAKAEAMRIHIEEFKKSKLAILMKKYEPNYPTVSAQEREARADSEYIDLLDGLKESTETAEKLRWELKISQMAVDIWRTKQANRRRERDGYGA